MWGQCGRRREAGRRPENAPGLSADAAKQRRGKAQAEVWRPSAWAMETNARRVPAMESGVLSPRRGCKFILASRWGKMKCSCRKTLHVASKHYHLNYLHSITVHMSATLHASFAARCAPQWCRAPQSPTKCRRVPQRLRVSADAGRVRTTRMICFNY